MGSNVQSRAVSLAPVAVELEEPGGPRIQERYGMPEWGGRGGIIWESLGEVPFSWGGAGGTR